LKKEEFELPQFPALEKCIIVDARHSSRNELVKDLSASTLFLKMIEAKSIANGLGMMEAQTTDALCVGSSVSVEAACELISRAKVVAASADCAYLAVLEAGSAGREALLAAGAHSVIEKPYSRMRLFEKVVEAVVKANANSSWASLYNKCVENGIFGTVLIKEQPPAVNELGSVVVLEDKVLTEAMQKAMAASTEGFKGILLGIESGQYNLDPSGAPTRRTREAIATLVDEMLGLDPELEQGALKFKRFFAEAALQWMLDLVKSDQKQATENFRLRLLTFKPE